MSRMIEELEKQDIRLKSFGNGNYKVLCPRCSNTRKNKSDPCLSVTIQNGDLALWRCHNCEWQGSAGNVSGRRQDDDRQKEYKRPAPAQAKPGAFPVAALELFKTRSITPEVIARNRLYWDDRRKAICFPYYENGQLINVKYRTLDKKFQLEGGARLIFYGLDDVRKTDEIIIVEGEFDKLALEVCGITNVISVPNGAPSRIKEAKEGEILQDKAFEYLVQAEELVRNARKVVIAVDDDEAGGRLQYELVRRIGAHKCWIAKFGVKDANDSLMNNGADVTLDALRDAKPCPIKGLYMVNDFEADLSNYFQNGMKSGVSTGYANLDEIFTIKPSETTVVTGVPNNGKSEFVDAIMMNVAKNENWKSCIFSPEHKKEHHVTKLIEKVVGLPAGPKADDRMSLEQYMNAAAWVNRYFHFIVADDYDDMPNLDWVLEKATAAVFRHGIKFFLLDPWIEIQLPEPKRGVSETDHIGQNFAKVMRWGKRYDVANFIIAHPAKISADKDGKTRVPVLYDIHGSAHWVNKPDNGLVVHINDDAASHSDIYVRKVRDKNVGCRGKVSLKYEKKTGTYSVPSTGYYDKAKYEPDSETF
jgi:twinkle protein